MGKQLTTNEILNELDWILISLDGDLENCTLNFRFEQKEGKELEKAIEYWKGEIAGLARYAWKLFEFVRYQVEYKDFENHFFVTPTRRQKDNMAVTTVGPANSWDVAVNHIYGHEVEEGQILTCTERPWRLFRVIDCDRKVNYYGIFADDPGQQDYAIFDDDYQPGFGSYNFLWETECVYYYIQYLVYKYNKKLDSYLTTAE